MVVDMIEIRIKEICEWRVGEVVEGEMIWTPEKEVKSARIKVELDWTTEGRGNRDSGTVAAVERECRAPIQGAGIRLPFSLRIPEAGPVSYDGKLIRIIWMVRAQADISWTIDEEEQRVIRVGPALANEE